MFAVVTAICIFVLVRCVLFSVLSCLFFTCLQEYVTANADEITRQMHHTAGTDGLPIPPIPSEDQSNGNVVGEDGDDCSQDGMVITFVHAAQDDCSSRKVTSTARPR